MAAPAPISLSQQILIQKAIVLDIIEAQSQFRARVDQLERSRDEEYKKLNDLRAQAQAEKSKEDVTAE
jgi:hypothetical protein